MKGKIRKGIFLKLGLTLVLAATCRPSDDVVFMQRSYAATGWPSCSGFERPDKLIDPQRGGGVCFDIDESRHKAIVFLAVEDRLSPRAGGAVYWELENGIVSHYFCSSGELRFEFGATRRLVVWLHGDPVPSEAIEPECDAGTEGTVRIGLAEHVGGPFNP